MHGKYTKAQLREYARAAVRAIEARDPRGYMLLVRLMNRTQMPADELTRRIAELANVPDTS